MYVFGSHGVGGELVRRLDLGFNNPVGTGGVWDVRLYFGCGGVWGLGGWLWPGRVVVVLCVL